MTRHFMGLAAVLAVTAAPLTGSVLAQTAVKAAVTIPFVTQQPVEEWLPRCSSASLFAGQKTVDKAVELKDEAVKKIDDMRGSVPAKQ